MEDERKQHQQDLAERDFAADQTRKKYQGEFSSLSTDCKVLIWPSAELAQLTEGIIVSCSVCPHIYGCLLYRAFVSA